MKAWKRWLILVAIALVLLTTFAAPSGGPETVGSTYGRTPAGYGAWYAFMESRGAKIDRWRRPESELYEADPAAEGLTAPMTLLQVHSTLWPYLDSYVFEEPTKGDDGRPLVQWLQRGNTLVVLGVETPISGAPFRTSLETEEGLVSLAGRRRYALTQADKLLLGDRFGAVVWERSIGKGRVIVSTDPHLAANAYQDAPANFDFLARLVGTDRPVLVDEYLHGYKDEETLSREVGGSWVAYLGQTPLLPVALQGALVLLVFLWAANRRFGPAIAAKSPREDNTQAYIQALAQVLHKAGCSEFVMNLIQREEQRRLQVALGLGPVPLDPRTLEQAWVQKTGRSAQELRDLLPGRSPRRLREQDLLIWLDKWQTLRQTLKTLGDRSPAPR
ncbi:DUF4350 domain-containing protein [Geitlerinema sp. PCC 7407]|uniref:DUF4350 domain-containing protein n=1 Tax=Geitlerinema sp. PCC 7407 TaxID=1173025 RepID=UPI00029FD0F8|nr:DUF4350 domain-containing protein [Geitlerinema sp. PCC 7407]AFY65170.1 hypothetical protein GEI7407_0672 [Geitlerinema sp. PCC 7407]